MIHTAIHLACDGYQCGEIFDGVYKTGTEARRAAKDHDWQNVASGDFCPTCNEKRISINKAIRDGGNKKKNPQGLGQQAKAS